MRLLTFDQTRAKALERLSIPAITEPFCANVLWVRFIEENDNPDYVRGIHSHSFFEAHFVLSGEITYAHKGKEYTLAKNMGIVFAPNAKHVMMSARDNAQRLSITWSVHNEENAFDSIRITGVKTAALSNSEICDIAGICHEFEQKSAVTPILVRNRIISLLSAFADFTQPCADNAVTDVRIEHAKRYIEDNPQLFLTCKAVAGYCHFNVKYFGRIFKETTGMSLLQYIHAQKRSCAMKMLADTDMNLAEIATSLGFKNEYYFNTFFRRMQGISPGEYRRLIKK